MEEQRQHGLAELLAKYEQVIVRSLTILALIADALMLCDRKDYSVIGLSPEKLGVYLELTSVVLVAVVVLWHFVKGTETRL